MPNPTRIAIWEQHLAAAQARLAAVDTDYPAADFALREKIRAGAVDDVKTAREFIEFHSK